MINLFIILLLLFRLVPHSCAIYDPLSIPNNKFGIHIADLNDIADVPALVNTNGGDWGYVTLVSTDSDRNKGKWQTLFDQMRRTHLIPIVRLATHIEKDAWSIPNPVDFDKIVSFFNDLNWPIKNRYIIVYNEPNHAKEWGGTINPEEYARDLVQLSQKFKKASDDFFILPAGLDFSAVTDNQSLNASVYLARMVSSSPDLLSSIDGWTSHSYPNPGFSGSVYAQGRGTIASFIWEMGYLRSLGLSNTLPVFITETGWTHNQENAHQTKLLSTSLVGSNLAAAANGIWKDPQIAVITTFIFNYQSAPFDVFSWRRIGNNGYYAHYDAYREIPKIKGEPVQHEEYVLSNDFIPERLVADSSYTFSAVLENKGHAIITPSEFVIKFEESNNFTIISDALPNLEPNEKGTITIHIRTPSTKGTYRVKLVIVHNGRDTILQERYVTIVPPPSLSVNFKLGWRRTSTTSGVTLLVYDRNNILIKKSTGLSVINGIVTIENLSNIIPNASYRVVVLVPKYLPRQSIANLSPDHTNITLKRFLPLDINGDGTLTIYDLLTMFHIKPEKIIRLFIGP